MLKIKYFSMLLGLCFLASSCLLNFNDKKDKEEEKIKFNEEDEKDDDVIHIEVNGEDLKIDADKLEEEITSSVNKMVEELTESLEGLNNTWDEEDREETELMDHRDLKALLPDRLGWMKQTEHSSERSGFFGFRVATAEARYESKNKWIEIELVDLGGMPIARIGLNFWDEMDIDRESKEEVERTYMKNGDKYHEKYNKKSKEGELKTVLSERYVLSVKGGNVSLDDLEDARDKVKTRRLD